MVEHVRKTHKVKKDKRGDTEGIKTKGVIKVIK